MAKIKTTPLGRRVMALFLATIMCVSLVQISAFATGGLTPQQEANKAAQVTNAGGTEEVVQDKVKMTKTAEVTDTEGKFKITLQVQTKDKIKQLAESTDPSIDVVLVIDNSSSMNDQSRLKNAKSSATQFVNTFLGTTPNGKRRIAVVSFDKAATTQSSLSSDLTALRGTPQDSGHWETKQVYVEGHWEWFIIPFYVEGRYETQRVFVPTGGEITYTGGAINKIGEKKDAGTNIQAGLKSARDILSSSTAKYKYVLLLTDGRPTYRFDESKQPSVPATGIIKVQDYNQDKFHTKEPLNNQRFQTSIA